MLRAADLCAFFSQSYEHLAAQYLRIGIRRLSKKVFIERLDREYRGIYARQSCGKGNKLVTPQIELYGYGFLVAVLNVALYGTYCNFRFNHITIFPQNYKNYSLAYLLRIIYVASKTTLLRSAPQFAHTCASAE